MKHHVNEDLLTREPKIITYTDKDGVKKQRTENMLSEYATYAEIMEMNTKRSAERFAKTEADKANIKRAKKHHTKGKMVVSIASTVEIRPCQQLPTKEKKARRNRLYKFS